MEDIAVHGDRSEEARDSKIVGEGTDGLEPQLEPRLVEQLVKVTFGYCSD